VKTTFKLKINIKRNPLNFKSIQWNHLQAFPISRDYPFKALSILYYELYLVNLYFIMSNNENFDSAMARQRYG
jgi:hypothetical protein